MPATIPTRPAAGAVVDTAWGQDMHDRTYLAAGCIATGSATALGTSTVTDLDLRNRVQGNIAYMYGDNYNLVVPAGLSGLYLCQAAANLTGAASGGVARLSLLQGGNYRAGATIPTYAGITLYAMVATSIIVADGELVRLQGFCNAAGGSFQVTRFVFLRIGNNIPNIG